MIARKHALPLDPDGIRIEGARCPRQVHIGNRAMGERGYVSRMQLISCGAAEALEETFICIGFHGDGAFYTDPGYTSIYVE